MVPVLLWVSSLYHNNRSFSHDATKESSKLFDYLSPNTDANDLKSSPTVANLVDNDPNQNLPSNNQEVQNFVSGIDVSHYQGKIDWGAVSESGIQFALTKATGGDSFVDPEFSNNWHGIRSNEIIRGAYHFFYASSNPVTQANHFLKTVGPLEKSDFPPILDIEILDNATPGLLVSNAIKWLESVEDATGKRPIVYTDVAFGKQYLNDPRFGKYALWIAEYAEKVKAVPDPWSTAGWKIWQHNQSGRVKGIDGAVDMDIFQGTKAELQGLIADLTIGADE